MRKILPAFLKFSLFLLVLLPCAYLLIIFFFHGKVELNTPKFVEESSKIVASLALSIIAFGMTQVGEVLKIKRKADSLQGFLNSMLQSERKKLEELYATEIPAPAARVIEDLRINTEFYQNIRPHIDEIAHWAQIAESQVLKAEPEVLKLCSDHADLFRETLTAIDLYAKQPCRTNLNRFRDSVNRLIHFSKSN